MRKLRWVLSGLAALLAAGAFMAWPKEDRISRENYERIRRGMSRPEVEAILGAPGDYRSGPTRLWLSPGHSRDLDQPSADRLIKDDLLDLADLEIERQRLAEREGLPPDEEDRHLQAPIAHWEGDSASVRVWYDESEKVGETIFHRGERRAQGPLDNVLWRVNRQWQKWFPER